MKPILLRVFLAALLLTGCAAYHLGPAKPSYLKNVKTIAVPSFRNGTLVPRLEVPVANIVIKQFQQDGTYQIVPEGTADAILEGTVSGLERLPARSLRGNVLATTEFVLNLSIKFTLTDRVTGKVLSQRMVVGTTNFFVGGDLQQDEQQAIPLAAENAAVQIVALLSEGF